MQPKYSASIRFVLPAPFGPVITVRPSPELHLGAVVAAKVTHRQAHDLHRRTRQTLSLIGMIRYRKRLSSPASISPGRSGLISFSSDVALLDRLQPGAQELGVETDLERLALEGDRHRLQRLADVRRLGRDRQLAGRERQP